MRLASIFQNHAVLQRHQPIPVWGTGKPGATARVRLADQEAITKVDNAGRWLLRLQPMPEGGPYTLVASDGSTTLELQDILIGEVWLCSGQSNMAWKLSQIGEPDTLNLPHLPEMRLLTVTNGADLGQAFDIQGEWKPATPETLTDFSAVAGYFGRRLHEILKVPVGLICNAWGGTRVQAWMSREALMLEPEGAAEIAFLESQLWNTKGARLPTFQEWEATVVPRGDKNIGLPQGWASPDFDDSGFDTMEQPTYWNLQGHNYNGIFWFRRTVEIPDHWVGRELQLSLGAIDKHDETWVNGCLVGAMGRETKNVWTVPRLYTIPPSSERKLVIAVRVRSHCYSGGFVGPASSMWVAPADAAPQERIPLAGTWRYAVEQNWGIIEPPPLAWGEGNANTPAILFNNRVAPLIPYGIRGVIWYQGESNVIDHHLYRRYLSGMIRDWRRAWGAGPFPFLQVQLASYLGASPTPQKESALAALREAQLEVFSSLPAMGLAVAIDLGEATDIHPRNKRDVGYRLAQSALHSVYRREAVPMGPLYTGMTLENGRIRCHFQHVAGGLTSTDGGPLRHFAIAGLDRVFHWANAEIEGDTVVVWSPEVPTPYAVRYAWADNPEGCNLANSLGLPAVPFRTDRWPVALPQRG